MPCSSAAKGSLQPVLKAVVVDRPSCNRNLFRSRTALIYHLPLDARQTRNTAIRSGQCSSRRLQAVQHTSRQQGDWKYAGSFLEPVVKQGHQLPCPPEQVQELRSMSSRSLQPYIRKYGNWTSATITSGTITAKLCLMSYCDEMVRVCCYATVDHVHICSALTGLSEACQASARCYGDDASKDSDLQQIVQLLATTLCGKLMGFAQCLQARDCAVALHALASLQIQPDSCQPGLSEALGSAIMRDTVCYNAKQLVKALLACSRLGLKPAVKASWCRTLSSC